MMIQLKLQKNVGKNSQSQATDVVIVQSCLAGIKVRTMYGMRPIWPGKIDGKNSKELIGAIETFEASENLKVTGRVEAIGGTTWRKLKQKTPTSALTNLPTKLAHVAPSPGQPKRYTLDKGVKLDPAIEKLVAQIANAYYAATTKTIHVTSGTRSPAKQAAAMFDNMKRGRRLTIYRNQILASQIRNAFDTAQAAGQSDQATISAMEQVIAKQVASGQYISKHLIARAVDIESKNMVLAQKKAFKAVASTIAKSVILETANPHWHLQF